MSGSVHEAGANTGKIGEQMLDPGPCLSDCRDDGLGTRTVGDVGDGQVDHQELAIGADCDGAQMLESNH